MSTPLTATAAQGREAAGPRRPGATAALGAALLGFFVITLDALVVNVALPSIRADRLGARRTFGVGLVVFVAASAAGFLLRPAAPA
ncbi:hypothetical protein [Streptomyces sp. T12]|uniref:hypothetical protein n=1 Tax=Streptomyces sp. T12 TaxID=477697 RepID=UPI0035A3412C